MRKRRKAKRPSGERQPLQAAHTINEVWSMDFVADSLVNGRRLKLLTVADDFTHECVDIAADYGISGQYVTRLLDQAALLRGYPRTVRTDNVLNAIGDISSGNSTAHRAAVATRWRFFNPAQQARSTIAAWRRDYNEVRPHSSLGRIAPARFAEQHRRQAGDAVQKTNDKTDPLN